MKKQLSTILSEDYNITAENYEDACRTSREQGVSVGEILIKKELLTETEYLQAVSIHFDIPLILNSVNESSIKTDFTSKVSIQYLKKHIMVPLRSGEDEESVFNEEGETSDNNDLSGYNKIIAVNNPASLHCLDDLEKILEITDYNIVLCPQNNILSVINMAYDQSRDSAQQLVDDMEEDSSTIIKEIEATADLLDDTSDSPIIKLVNHIISQSIKARASDIHIEPYQDSFKVRYRVDGILYDLLSPNKRIQAPLISRIKVMANLDIAEKRLPQDGRIEVKIGEQDVDIRVSTIPTSFGERVVLRLLNKSNTFLELNQFGIDEKKLEIINDLIYMPNGIILVTGPTGSGKTTTLYAILSRINSSEKNIITVEDPVEYQIEGIGQIQVNRKINLTFASGLRSIVRQDPDVILVGEIRDQETAEIAIQSALTGHLVFSTVHTNDSASAVTRLVEFGVEPFLITSAVKAVIAQRLIRVLCPECKEVYRPDDMTIESLGFSREVFDRNTIYRAKGCPACLNKGYQGRAPIFEILVFDNEINNTVLKTSDSNIIKEKAVANNMITLRDDGIDKVLKGISTIEEVLRVAN